MPWKWSETPEKIYNYFDETSNNWHLLFLVQTLETTDYQTTPVQNEHRHIQNLSYKNYFITVVFILLLKDNPNVLLRESLTRIVGYSILYLFQKGPDKLFE